MVPHERLSARLFAGGIAVDRAPIGLESAAELAYSSPRFPGGRLSDCPLRFAFRGLWQWTSRPGCDRRVVLGILLLTWLCSRIGTVNSGDTDGTDVELYFKYAVRGVDFHEVPYRDFDIEYPPLAYWFVVLPRLVDRAPVAPADLDKVSECAAFNRYGDCYEAQAVVCDALAFIFLLLLAFRRWPRQVLPIGLIYLACTTFLWPLLFVRLDIGLTLLLMAWAYFWVRSTETAPRAGWYRVLAYAALGMSISFKLVPVIAIPFLILSELRTPRPGGTLAWRH